MDWRELDPVEPQGAVNALPWAWTELSSAKRPQPDIFAASCAELGIEASADRNAIQAAYRAMVLKHHPDRAHPSVRAEAEERMKRINVAYQLLLRKYGEGMQKASRV
ncbi:J domain-containing protein [Terriglobus sp. RCC_193]|uniref:J domain-containing protein n=1 Tax=Terriglobus sp. RCC_193 TaxID=3239218 RepID=UPI003524E6E6